MALSDHLKLRAQTHFDSNISAVTLLTIISLLKLSNKMRDLPPHCQYYHYPNVEAHGLND